MPGPRLEPVPIAKTEPQTKPNPSPCPFPCPMPDAESPCLALCLSWVWWGLLFDLSLAAKRRMRLISWLAFGVLSLTVRRRHRRRRQIAECRARYLIPPPTSPVAVSGLLSHRRCRLNRTTTGDIKIMKCAGVVDSLLARPADSHSQLWPGLVWPGLTGSDSV